MNSFQLITALNITQATYKHTRHRKSYLQWILGIPYDRLVGFASWNALQVNEEDNETEKMFRNHGEG